MCYSFLVLISLMGEFVIYLLGDQPTTCPFCGSRTDFYDIHHSEEYYQIHFCRQVSCGFIFIAMED